MRGILFLILILISGGAMGVDSEIRILSDAIISGSEILLTEVSEIKNTQSTARKALDGVSLGQGPEVGKTSSLTRESLSELLRAHGEILNSFHVIIPEKLIVRRVARKLSEAGLQTDLEKEIRKTTKEGRLVVRLSSIPKEVISEKYVSWKIDITKDLSLGNVAVPLILDLEGGTQRRVWINANVKCFKKVFVAKHEITSRSPIEDADFAQEERDVTNVAGTLAQIDDLKNAMARTNIPADSVVTRNLLERKTAVVAGEDVRVLVGDETFQIEAKGVALQGGFVGDVIKIRNSYNKQISGQVIAKGQVRVDLK